MVMSLGSERWQTAGYLKGWHPERSKDHLSSLTGTLCKDTLPFNTDLPPGPVLETTSCFPFIVCTKELLKATVRPGGSTFSSKCF